MNSDSAGAPATPERCPTRVLGDVPERGEDAFGSHGRIAHAIAELILTPPAGAAGTAGAAPCIGLSGAWGSGKSTVIALLENECRRRTTACVFWVFDAWSHEGDPLRRTFLESLIRRLIAEGWLPSGPDSPWTEKLETLAKRRRFVERRSTPRLTPLAAALALSVLLVPVGNSIFGTQTRGGIQIDLALPIDHVAALGLGLMLAPGALLALCGAIAWLRSPPANSTRWSQVRQVLTTFVYRAESESRTETVESGDQTSLEFEAAFEDTMQECLGDFPERRLVLVIDNLDRIGASQALGIWSTLQTFLRRAEASARWRERLWCVLTFDEMAIRRLWEQGTSPGSMIAESFLDKTFQVRFEVPLPNLTSWKGYLLRRLETALPAHSAEEFFSIYRLFAATRSSDSWPAPTPRELTLFVNQIAALHRVWQHEIPLADLAYFVLLRREGHHIVAELLKGAVPAPRVVPLVSDQIHRSLEALTHGASNHASQEVQLRQEILEALEAADQKRLLYLSRWSSFWDVLELAVDHRYVEWQNAEAGRLLHSVLALSQEELAGSAPVRHANVLSRLVRIARKTSQFVATDQRAVAGMLALARLEPLLARKLLVDFVQVHTQRPEPLQSAKRLVHWYVQLVRGLEGLDVPAYPLRIPGSAETYAAAARALMRYDREGKYWSRLRPGEGVNLAALLQPPLLQHWATVARVAFTANSDAETARQFVTAAAQLLKDVGSDAERVIAPLTTLLVLSEHGYASNALAEFAKGQVALDLALAELDETPLTVLHGAAASLLSILKIWPSFFRVAERWSDNRDPAMPLQMTSLQAKSLARWNEPDERRGVALAKATRDAGHASILLEAARGGWLGSGKVLLQLSLLRPPRRVLPLDLVQQLPNRSEIVRALAQRDDTLGSELVEAGFDSSQLLVYAAALTGRPGSEATFVDFCVQGVESMNPSRYGDLLALVEASDALFNWIGRQPGPHHDVLCRRFWHPIFRVLTAPQQEPVLSRLGYQLLRGSASALTEALGISGMPTTHDFWRSLPPAVTASIAQRCAFGHIGRRAFGALLRDGALAPPPPERIAQLRDDIERQQRGEQDTRGELQELLEAVQSWQLPLRKPPAPGA